MQLSSSDQPLRVSHARQRWAQDDILLAPAETATRLLILDGADQDLDDAGAIEDEQSPPAELATSSE